MSLFSDAFLTEDEEEKKKEPSQQAAQEVKRSSFAEAFNLEAVAPTPKPAEQQPIVQEQKKGVLQKAGEWISGLFKKKDEPAVEQEKPKNPIESYNGFLNSTLLKNMEDKYAQIDMERKKSTPDNNKISKLEDEIQEIDGALSLPAERFDSMGTKYKVGSKYEFTRDIRSFKAGLGELTASLTDALTKVTEQDKPYQEKRIAKLREQGKNDMADQLTQLYGIGKDPKTREISQNIKKWSEETRPSNPDFLDQVSEAGGSMAAFIVLSVATGGGATLMSLAEATSEAGSVYEQNREKGMSINDANNEANKDFMANVVINYFTNKLGLFSGEKAGIKKTIVSTTTEGVQEGAQQLASNLTTGKDPMEGVLESMGVGSVLGGGFSIVMPSGEVIEVTEPREGTVPIETTTPASRVPTPEELDDTVENVRKYMLTPESRLSDTTINTLKSTKIGVNDLPFGEDGTITVYRQGDVKAGQPTSFSLEQKDNQKPYVINKEEVLINTNSQQLKDLYNSIYEGSAKEIYTEALERWNKLESEIIAMPTEIREGTVKPKTQEVKVYHGEKGTVLESKKSFDKVLEVKGYQPQLLQTLASQGNVEAQKVLDNKTGNKIDFVSADKVIREALKGRYDAISYDNSTDGRKAIGKEYFDLKDGKFYAENEDTAKVYAKQTREGKYKTEEKPAQKTEKVIEKKEVIKVEPKKEEKKKPVKKKVVKDSEQKAPSGFATTGTYDSKVDPEAPNGITDIGDLSVSEAQEKLKGIKPVAFPELVRLAKELTGKVPELNARFKNKLGVAKTGRGVFSASIELNPKIFENEELMSKVLAHELGHITDYFDTGTMARGNLVGRIMSLNKYLKDEFGDLKNPTLKKELTALTQLWNPFDPSKNEAYTKYRFSAAELYADALSVMFNQPSLLKQKAPTFWNAFFEFMDKKPKVKEAFFATWDLLNKGEEAVGSERDKAIREMFTKGEDLYRMKILEKQQEQNDIKAFLRNTFIDKNSAAIKKVEQAKKEGKYVPDEQNPIYMLEGINYLNGFISSFIDKNYQPIWKNLQKDGLSWEQDLGQVLFLERVVNERSAAASPFEHFQSVLGDGWTALAKNLPSTIEKQTATQQLKVMENVFSKMNSGLTEGTLWDELSSMLPKGIANPQGYNQTTAKEQLKFLEKQLGAEKWAKLQESLEKYREANKKVLEIAEKEGFYRPELLKEMKANPAYATFQVLDYLDTHIPASIKQQVGTLKDIASPTTSTLIKNISIIKAVERNKATRTLVEFMQQNFPTEIEEAKYMFNGRYQVPVESKAPSKKLVTFMKDGKFVGYYVDFYVAQATEFWSTPLLSTAGKILKIITVNRFYRPLFITFNLGFQSFNLMRDAFRFYKNVPSIKWWQVWKTPALYAKAVPSSLRRAWDIPDALISEMRENKIMSVTYNDIANGATEESSQMEKLLQGYDLLKPEQKLKFIKPIMAILDVVERTGNFIESLPKVAGYLELQGKLPKNELASFIRTSVGSPDFMRKGTFYPVYNEIFLFSNAIKEGMRSDLAVMTNPTTRSGFWMKTAVSTLTPKVLMAAALYGLLGEKIKEMMQNVSEYDMSNYIIVPLGIDPNGKTVYLRIPTDETGRLFGAMLYKGLTAAVNEQSATKDLQDVFSFGAGQIPSLAPSLTLFIATKQFLAGENPYDYFRGRNVIPDQEFQAGGQYALKPFVQWALNTVGLGVVFKSYSSFQAPESKTWIQKVTEAPVLSNILGRWIKVSDYGQYEKNKKITDSVKQQSARDSLERNTLIDKAVTDYRTGEQTPQRRLDFERKLRTDLFGEPPYDASTSSKITNSIKKFRVGVIRGKADQNINSLISATSSEEKIQLLQAIKSNMDAKEFGELKDTLLREKVVSGEVFAQFERRNR